ncbi:PAS domain-containing protein [Hydrogenimonas cancrithermarum]|uniref:Methyl-accepting chemotaxis protein n=1 Tax=Hydrogenimonas cancrithermarum TaxID=2993563 RepID=A0ABM8FNI5_9BACT|nr:PAS domain S-box protein [Hydrogenimonas cancrithermarum]BDY13119.1 methyl-accepting chemotaxis protein [Hydrogenimonas cancrithermarum]
MARPTPIDEEITLDPKRYIVSKTDTKGVIEYGNDYFVQISGYKESELIGQPHNIIRHPDMPRIVFKMMWDRIRNRENIFAIVKNLAKDGRYYWVVTEFETKVDPLTNEITGYTAFRKAAPKEAVKAIEPIYEKLIEIEAVGGMEASEKYLRGYLEERGVTYDEFVNDLIGNKGLFKAFFKLMKKMFG